MEDEVCPPWEGSAPTFLELLKFLRDRFPVVHTEPDAAILARPGSAAVREAEELAALAAYRAIGRAADAYLPSPEIVAPFALDLTKIGRDQ